MLLKLISCGSLARVSVLVVTLLQGLRQHNQRIHALQERIDQLEERTPNRAHSELLSHCLLYTSPSPRDAYVSRMPSSA